MKVQNPTHLNNFIIADDDADDKEFFDHALKTINPKAKIFNVPNGKELMKLIDSFIPDILFLDLEMPEKNGLDCLVEIRSNPETENLPIVVFSSTTRPANIQTAYELGAHLFLIKPWNLKDYIPALQTICSMDWKNPNTIKEKYCINGRYVAFS